MKKISLGQAKKQGLRFYFSGIDCKNGNKAQRRVSDNRCQCVCCINENRARDQERSSRKKIYYEKNPEKFCERSRKWRTDNKDAYRLLKAKYRELNKSIAQKHHANRRSRKLDATPSWYGELDDFVLSEAFKLAEIRKQSTGFKWHVDHMIPLQAKNVCGLHVWNNFQVIPAYLNLSKGSKLIYIEPCEWLRELRNG